MADPTLQTVSQQFEDLKKRIATEGITDLNGGVLQAPTQPTPTAPVAPPVAAPTVPAPAAPAPAPTAPPTLPQPNGYTVQAGDTASGIATKLGIPLANISGFRSGNPNLIFPGETLNVLKTPIAPIPGAQPQQQPPAPAAQPPQLPQAPEAPPAAPGLLPESFEDEITGLLAKFGIKPPTPDQSPFTAFAETYKQLYSDLGLQTVKQRIESSTKSIEELEAKKNEEIAEVNENPFVAANIRAGQKRRIENKYESKINALVNRLKLDQGLFEAGTEQATFITQQALAQTRQNQQLTQDVVFRAMDVAQKQVESARKLAEISPAEFKEVQGGLYDIRNRTFIVPPKPVAPKAPGVIKPKPLSGEASKILSISKTIVPEINQLKLAFQKDYKGSVRGIVLGTDRRLSKLVDQVADKIGRLRSGGAINKDEEKRFIRQIASFKDLVFGRREDAIAALDALIKEANQVAGGITQGSQQQTGSLEDLFNQFIQQ